MKALQCLPVAVVMRNLCTHVQLLNAGERMSVDVAQFQDMWKVGPGNNCWTTSEQVWMKKLLS